MVCDSIDCETGFGSASYLEYVYGSDYSDEMDWCCAEVSALFGLLSTGYILCESSTVECHNVASSVTCWYGNLAMV